LQLYHRWNIPCPGTESTEVVMKYGDSDLADGSCAGTDIFIKYKDFESGNNGNSIDSVDDDWTVVSGGCEINTAQKFEGTRSLYIHGVDPPANAHFSHPAGDGYAFSARMRKNGSITNAVPFLHGNGEKQVGLYFHEYKNIKYYNAAGSLIDTTIDALENVWFLYEVRNINWSAGTCDYWFDGACIAQGAQMRNTADAADIIRVYDYEVHAGNSYTYIDNLIVRKYVHPEPVWGEWGEEELIDSGPVGVKTWNTIPSVNIKTWNDVLWNEIKSIT